MAPQEHTGVVRDRMWQHERGCLRAAWKDAEDTRRQHRDGWARTGMQGQLWGTGLGDAGETESKEGMLG